ncbi:3'-tRNA processing endonuclease Trz1 [Schizosaccharomyces cryophilus OY26]|uniref:ribonuclease Z n=1 Tax=Schizosaccharomyces cryophilus (strain OY26 / ATCC MYA-4695 / CBS 11777 / NBRC 106824 / NRRL Y48691) TaxID=653667 RepID=S9VMW9_SCHCR|nr:3'-tRNA processing endonuclease Trz1 [Schizosaccharomyces cryophilus OY26]EPY49313.1 3'-tRNA processing endonuclease Trz1 [Schizosaccharomyces cryophilus OY26]
MKNLIYFKLFPLRGKNPITKLGHPLLNKLGTTVQLRRAGQQMVRRKEKRNTNRISLNVISSVAADNMIAPLLCVTLDDRKYLIGNMGELMQLKFRNHPLNYGGKLLRSFMMPGSGRTYNPWSATAGLLGYVQSSEIDTVLDLHAPSRIASLIANSRNLTSGSSLKLNVIPFQNKLSEDHESFEFREKDFCTIQGEMSPSWSYLSFMTVPMHGTFNSEKAKLLGVPFGKANGLLCQGKSVLASDNKTWVRPEEVLGPTRPAQKFVIIGCSSPSALENLINYANTWEHELPSCIIHVLDKGVWGNEYAKFMKHPKLRNSTHLISCIELAKDSLIFRRNRSANVLPSCRGFLSTHLSSVHSLSENVFELEEGLSVEISDQKCFVKNENTENVGVKTHSFNELPSPSVGYVVDILGTSATSPTLYRSLSCYLVNVDNCFILLDCGEGSYSQLIRQYGTNLDSVLKQLRLIFISHMHADHWLGLVNILLAWNESTRGADTTLTVVCPKSLRFWVSRICDSTKLSHIVERIRFVNASTVHAGNEYSLSQSLSLYTVPSIHIYDSHSVILSHKSNGNLVYSSDTRPNMRLAKAGKNAAVLLHEATFEDDLHEEAVNRFHSTVSEALMVAKRMQAQKLILTHFSTRSIDTSFTAPNWSIYPKHKTIYARDGMRWTQSICQPNKNAHKS